MLAMRVDEGDRMAAPRRRWAVGSVLTGEELDVTKRLQVAGLEVYCPRFEKPVRKSWRKPWKIRGRKREVEVKAAFPGYLFVNADTIGNVEDVYETPGFLMFLRYEASGALKLLHDAAIDGLRALEAKGILIPTSLPELVDSFMPGEVVRIVGGPFGGMLGEVTAQGREGVTLSGYDFRFPATFPAEILRLERDDEDV